MSSRGDVDCLFCFKICIFNFLYMILKSICTMCCAGCPDALKGKAVLFFLLFWREGGMLIGKVPSLWDEA